MGNINETASVRISRKVIDKVMNNKKKTGVKIGTFFEMAAEEKLRSQRLTERILSETAKDQL